MAFVNTLGATVIGIIAGLTAAFAVSFKYRLGLDYSLDVLPIHGMSGLLGTLLGGLFGTAAVLGRIGLFYGGGVDLLGHQALAVVSVGLYSFAMTGVIAFAIRRAVGLRVSDDHETAGLDLSLHEETAYDFETSGGGRNLGAEHRLPWKE
jgi:ammonium transporter, Amt family